ncbi:MAG: peptidyl-prolyl cis-trans isomerase [Paracoccaceae bacterium]
MRRILSEPLVHFAALAGGLFILYVLVAGGEIEPDAKTITVGRAEMLEFIQFRQRSFDVDAAEEILDALSEQQLDAMVREYVREEALSREALIMGLDQNDYVIKRRLVQNMEYIARGFSEKLETATREDALDYYERNRDEFATRPRISFQHVFFSNEAEGAPVERAQALLDQVPDVEPLKQGDRFLFGQTFSDRGRPEIEGMFGPDMADVLFTLPVDGTWTGPFESEYGAHLVLAIAVEQGRQLAFEEVEARALRRAIDNLVELRTQQATDNIIAEYSVTIDLDAEEAAE